MKLTVFQPGEGWTLALVYSASEAPSLMPHMIHLKSSL